MVKQRRKEDLVSKMLKFYNNEEEQKEFLERAKIKTERVSYISGDIDLSLTNEQANNLRHGLKGPANMSYTLRKKLYPNKHIDTVDIDEKIHQFITIRSR